MTERSTVQALESRPRSSAGRPRRRPSCDHARASARSLLLLAAPGRECWASGRPSGPTDCSEGVFQSRTCRARDLLKTLKADLKDNQIALAKPLSPA